MANVRVINLQSDKPALFGPRKTKRWNESDVRLLQSEQGLAKLRSQTFNFPYEVNLAYLGDANPTEDFVKQVFKNWQEEFTVVYTNNVTTDHNYIPPTPWIAAHRMIHCMECQFQGWTLPALAPAFSKLAKFLINLYLQEFDENLTAKINLDRIRNPWSVLAEHTDIPKWPAEPSFWRQPMTRSNIVLNEILTHLCTFRSARMHKLQEGDEFAELWAQFCITGKISFNDHIDLPYASSLNSHMEEIHAFIPQLEADMRQLMQDLRGKIITF